MVAEIERGRRGSGRSLPAGALVPNSLLVVAEMVPEGFWLLAPPSTPFREL